MVTELVTVPNGNNWIKFKTGKFCLGIMVIAFKPEDPEG